MLRSSSLRVPCKNFPVFTVFGVLLSLTFIVSSGDATQIRPGKKQSMYPSTYFDMLRDAHTRLQFSPSVKDRATVRGLILDPIVRFQHVLNGLILGNSVKSSNISFHNDPRPKQGQWREADMWNPSENRDEGSVEDKDEVVQLLRSVLAVNAAAYTPKCFNDTNRFITGVRNQQPWAIQMFDAMGKPGPSITEFRLKFVGNYDQCKAVTVPSDLSSSGFKGKYATLVFKLRILPLEINLGACLPDSCSDKEITALLYTTFEKQVRARNITYMYSYGQTGETKMTSATKAVICILSIIGFFMLVGTIYDLLVIQRPKWTQTRLVTNANSVDLRNGHSLSYDRTQEEITITQNGEKSPLLPRSTPSGATGTVDPRQKLQEPVGILPQVLLSFSVYTNGKKLLNTSQPPGSLGAIHGIRFLSMSWVVLCHVFAFVTSFTLDSATAYPEFLNRWTFLPIANGFVSVDTFFTLSGLLTSYLTIKEIMRRNTWKINWPLFYFHRFWRLTPPYMLALVTVLGLSQYLGQGPLWSPVQPGDKKQCEDNWWTNLLYINNVIGDNKGGCFGHSWYLANDMQFFVLSPFMLVPFFFHPAAGMISCSVFLLTSWITTGALSTHNSWPATQESLKPDPGMASSREYMSDYYIKPWCRIGPFIVGIAAGYILATTKGKKFKINRVIVALGWILSIAAGLAVVYGLRGDVTGDNHSSIPVSALYNAVHSSVWGACVCWVIIACSAGYGGPVNALLSWSPFVVLGRLTYMSYLIHLCIVYTYLQNLDALLYFNDTNMVITFLGLLTFVNMAAFIGVLAFESPMLGLEKTFIKRDKKDK